MLVARSGDGFVESVPGANGLDGVLLAERKLPRPMRGVSSLTGVLVRLRGCTGEAVRRGVYGCLLMGLPVTLRTG